MKLSRRVSRIKPSATLAVSAQAKAMKAKGIDVIGFGAGEPDFDTPGHIKRAAVKALEDGFTKYTPASGIDELKDAVIEKLRSENGLKYQRNQVLVSCGAKHSLYNLFQAVLNPGDEVVIFAPYWVSYPDMAILAGARPVIIPAYAKEEFKVKPSRLRAKLSSKTRLVVINSPSNPTGAAYTRKELEDLARVLERRDLLVASDDIYEKIVYDGFRFYSIASVNKKLAEKTVVINGVSKTYAMTGWRIGYAAGPAQVIAAMSNIQSQSTSNPTSFSQKGALEAMTGRQGDVKKMVQEFKRRRDFMVKKLNAMPGVKCFKPRGAFYVFPDFSAHMEREFRGKKIKNSVEFCQFLLNEVKVAAVPGSAFGGEGHIRLSYATSMKNIREGLKRISHALEMLD
jgi:aspartate aminotransferase